MMPPIWETRSAVFGLGGRTVQGYTLGAEEPSDIAHRVKHVVHQEQWSTTTTPAEYIDDLRRAIGVPGARFALYDRGGAVTVAVIVPTQAVVPAARLGVNSEKYLGVFYRVNHGTLVSGYQVASIEDITMGKEILWR